MQLFLVRHGETESNRMGLALGRADIPLNEHGRWQAQRLAEGLAGEPLAAVYSSPLLRALHTAREIAARHGLEVQAGDGFIEMDVGELDGLTFAEVRSRYPGLLEVWVSPSGPEKSWPGGERLLDVQRRAWDAVEGLLQRHGEAAVCVVTHNFVILSLLTRVLGIELARFRSLRHSVGAVSVLELGPKRTILVRLNDTCHLEGD